MDPVTFRAFSDELRKIGAMSLRAIKGVNPMIRKAVPIPPIPRPPVRPRLVGGEAAWGKPAVPEYAK